MGVEFKRKEYIDNLPRWVIVDDTQKGQLQVKYRGETYLPFYGTQPRPSSSFEHIEDYEIYNRNYQALTAEQAARYVNYLKRAIFYNYVSRTVGGLVGMATKEPLIVEVDTGLQFAVNDIDGAGMSLSQQYKRCVELTVKHARCGLLVDYPPTDGEVTQEQINQGIARSYCTLYKADQIINWGEERVGADTRVNLVVLEECIQERAENGYDLEDVKQYRVLRLVDGLYELAVYDDKEDIVEGPFYPTDNSGNRLNFIPFQFVGAINNDVHIDESTVYDISSLNIGHYINSADYENSAWLCGQPMPWISGVDQNWTRENAGLNLGSGSIVPVPAGESFGVVQTQPNSQSYEAMQHKQTQMIALGAKMISDQSFSSATEAAINNQSETSYLQSVIDNVTNAYSKVLDWMGLFEGASVIEFKNPTDLTMFMADPQMLAQMVASWQTGLISKEDVRDYQRKIGVLDRTNEEIDDLVEMDDSGINLDGE